MNEWVGKKKFENVQVMLFQPLDLISPLFDFIVFFFFFSL